MLFTYGFGAEGLLSIPPNNCKVKRQRGNAYKFIFILDERVLAKLSDDRRLDIQLALRRDSLAKALSIDPSMWGPLAKFGFFNSV